MPNTAACSSTNIVRGPHQQHCDADLQQDPNHNDNVAVDEGDGTVVDRPCRDDSQRRKKSKLRNEVQGWQLKVDGLGLGFASRIETQRGIKD